MGMALAEAHLAARFNRPGFPVVDHYTYVLCGDGCLEEGISYEACSFAGTMGLGKLILLYDDNDITIEGDTDVTFRENIGARFAAQNWQVLHVDLATRPDDVEALSAAIEKAKARTDKPSIVICHTRIGYGSPLEGSEKSHGAPLGEENLQKTRGKARLAVRGGVRLPRRGVRTLPHRVECGRGEGDALEEDVRRVRIYLSRTRRRIQGAGRKTASPTSPR